LRIHFSDAEAGEQVMHRISLNQSIKTHLYSAICRERIRDALRIAYSTCVKLTRFIISRIMSQKLAVRCLTHTLPIGVGRSALST